MPNPPKSKQADSKISLAEAVKALREQPPVQLVTDLENQLDKPVNRRTFRTVCTI